MTTLESMNIAPAPDSTEIADGRVLLPWAASRLGPATFGPLALFVALAAASAGAAPTWTDAAAALGPALLALVALRLADDLADLPHDRGAHPERVLCRARPDALRAAAGAAAVLAGLAVALAALALGPGAAAALAAVVAGTAAALALLGGAGGRPVRQVALLAKYPALALALAPAALDPARAALAPGVVLAAVVAHELLHDPRAARARWAPALRAAALAALLAATPLAAARLGRPALALLALPSGLLLVAARRGRARAAFLAGLPALLLPLSLEAP